MSSEIRGSNVSLDNRRYFTIIITEFGRYDVIPSSVSTREPRPHAHVPLLIENRFNMRHLIKGPTDHA